MKLVYESFVSSFPKSVEIDIYFEKDNGEKANIKEVYPRDFMSEEEFRKRAIERMFELLKAEVLSKKA